MTGLSSRGILVWLATLLVSGFLLGFLGPLVVGPWTRAELPYLAGASLLLALLGCGYLRDESWVVKVCLGAFVYMFVPGTSCLGFATLNHSPLQPLSYGVRKFVSEQWRQPRGERDFDRTRSQMTAHLLLGGLLHDKPRSEVRRMLGAADCGAKASEDAWYLGFASDSLDPDCLHVWYLRDHVSRAQVLQH